MARFRIIPMLSLDQGRLVKTVKFKKPKYIGDPINAIRIFNDKEVDELSILDIRASINRQPPNFKLLEEMASECFMPISYGGGITSVHQVKILFELGVEKVILNSVLFSNKNLVSELSGKFGSQSIVGAIDYKKNWLGKKKIVGYSASKSIGLTIENYAKKLEFLGCGELILTSVDNDGTFFGLDLEIAKEVAEAVNIPVICCGGLNSLKNINQAFDASLSAVSGGSFFVYKNNDPKSILINYPNANEINCMFQK